jgi:glycine/sarcosine N-methyltransferase
MYTNLACYFDAIFPVGDMQLGFIKGAMPEINGQTVLDAACGSGGYAIALARDGYRVTGIDLDPGMIAYAREKAYELEIDVKFRIEDLRYITEEDGKFSAIICIGNSLPHLLLDEDIQKALAELRRVLKAGGTLILQTVNYDWILRDRPDSLPQIRNNELGITFTRNYTYREDGLIDFRTCLTVKSGETKQDYGGTIKLRPLTRNDLTQWLQKSGFHSLEFYGGFDRSPHMVQSFHTVVTARV